MADVAVAAAGVAAVVAAVGLFLNWLPVSIPMRWLVAVRLLVVVDKLQHQGELPQADNSAHKVAEPVLLPARLVEDAAAQAQAVAVVVARAAVRLLNSPAFH